MGVGIGKPLAREPLALEPVPFSGIQQVVVSGFRQVSPLQEYGPGTLLADHRRCLLHVFPAVDGKTRQGFPFLHVGGDQGGQGQQLFLEILPGFFFQEITAGGGHHHRIHHQNRGCILLHFFGDGTDQGGIGHHPHLDPVHPDILEHRIDLGFHHLRIDVLDGRHSGGVLGRHSGDHAHAVAAMGGKSLQVCLDAGAAGRIRPGNGQQMEHDFLLLS